MIARQLLVSPNTRSASGRLAASTASAAMITLPMVSAALAGAASKNPSGLFFAMPGTDDLDLVVPVYQLVQCLSQSSDCRGRRLLHEDLPGTGASERIEHEVDRFPEGHEE